MKSYYQENCIEAGCDEAGRGCLAGPVFAAAVILPHDFRHKLLTDSKKLPEKVRYRLRSEIEKNAISYAVSYVDNHGIDEMNILKASIKAMHLALNDLKITPEHILIDGNKFYPYQSIPYKCIIKGDSLYYSIAAASILAKTYRDDYMCEIDKKHPQYLWKKNKGYPTSEHRQAIVDFGITDYHRRSYQLLDKQLKLVFVTD